MTNASHNKIKTNKANISIIVAVSENGAIGKNNQLLWHLPKDFQFFKKHTIGKSIIMGKNTWLSLPLKPLPDRKNVILSKTIDPPKHPNVVCHSTPESITWIDSQEYVIIGGSQIYQYFLPYANKLYLTRVHHPFEADTFFPDLELSQWEMLENHHHPKDQKHAYDFSCSIYQKKPPSSS